MSNKPLSSVFWSALKTLLQSVLKIIGIIITATLKLGGQLLSKLATGLQNQVTKK